MRLLAFLSLAAGLVTARPATCSEELPAASSDCPTLCIDGINDCNEPWGGCFNVCKPEESPTMPPCSEPTPTLMPIYHDTPTPTAPQSDDCSTRSVCADYVNECGIWYGGCFADCTPWPTFTKRPALRGLRGLCRRSMTTKRVTMTMRTARGPSALTRSMSVGSSMVAVTGTARRIRPLSRPRARPKRMASSRWFCSCPTRELWFHG
ncbi:uncharacterized protein VDAG_04434 [Verticillium dahliae VdLs.17]|uniref:Uncharacterized protein n=1 Tax=Verticillium dahliae (strain VdLs.17 / ATCC MYA-4575 / FGSC 10137) TaxID=498257 RepID=G2X2B0_VERDV|nr:uncharacterized protein VDAG_04434 [Verticillium dahliae VdLs.17]EGY22996.1 hypothetical protein VDAG_04434 [Verticillium dahliae VdLs.17]